MSEKKPVKPVRHRPERERKLAAGLCLWCGGKPDPGRKFCPTCLEKQRQRYAANRAAALCYCGRPRAEGRTRCEGCLHNNGKAKTALRERKNAKGVCACGRPRRPGKKTCEACAARGLKRDSSRRAAGLCRCGKNPASDGLATCEPCREYKTDRVRRLRATVIAGYGGRCACCAEDDENVLEFDHVNGDGKEHRREIGLGSDRVYEWIIKNGFPDRIQMLCANCHTAKTRTGDCSYRRGR